ncbi:MAG: hypothetical protein HC890_17625, partial [Chloroflexaceae bacterium]|nr:hypothetical protein [Chloroflexaceae bacterium]
TALSSGNPLPGRRPSSAASGRVLPTETIISLNELPANLQANPGTFNPETDGIDFFESIEGMLVTVEDAVVVSPREDFGGGSPFEFLWWPTKAQALRAAIAGEASPSTISTPLATPPI